MLLVFPWRSDAPLYHGPWATLGVIAAYLGLAAVDRGPGGDIALAWSLAYDDGVQPLAWITSALAHAGWVHLLGNLIAFWVFAPIIEGKLGWWRFLLVVLGIMACSGAIEQAAFWGNEGYSLGLSGVVYALMAMALIWAP